MKRAIHILIADDNTIFRKTILRELADHDIHSLGEASNGVELLQLLSKNDVDVVLLDLEMPVKDGNETLDEILANFPGTKVIIFSSYDASALIEDYYSRGVMAYVSKHEMANNTKDLADIIHRVHQHGSLYTHKTANSISRHYSTRQKMIISMICRGKTNKEIAKELGIVERSVEKQRQKIYEKTNAKGTVEFLRHAFKSGLDLLGVKKLH